MPDVTVSARAARRIGEILKGERAGAMLRVSVEGGGCSGFQYKFDIEHAKADDDIEIARPGTAPPADTVSVSGRVTGVEYQGYFVKVMLDAGGSKDFVAYVSERKFFNNPVTIGDNVLATWPVDVARLLR